MVKTQTPGRKENGFPWSLAYQATRDEALEAHGLVMFSQLRPLIPA